MSNFFLKLEAAGGSDIEKRSTDAVSIANKLGVTVTFDFNGVLCMACPGDDAFKLSKTALRLIKLDNKSKSPPMRIATGH